MIDVNERLARVEHELEAVVAGVGGLRTEVGGLRIEVGGLRTEVGGLRGEVQKLRVLEEEDRSQIRLIAEVQSRHGEVLEQHGALLNHIVAQLAPLPEIHTFVKQVTANFEARITDLEKAKRRHVGCRSAWAWTQARQGGRLSPLRTPRWICGPVPPFRLTI